MDTSKVIDKFLLSMHNDKKYYFTVQQLLNQRQNEEMTLDYCFVKLTLTEVESHLYTDDENSENQMQAYLINTNKNYDKKHEKYAKRQKYRWENRLCFFSGKNDHHIKDCPNWKE